MIDVKEILRDFEEVDIETLATEYGITDERASISVSLYNKALSKMNIGSYDAARIDLRKSVNMYPNFVEARMLLGVCVFALGERTEAVAIFNTVKGDNRERALNYLDKLQELSTRPESASFKSVSRQSRVPDSYYTESKLDEIMKAAPASAKNDTDNFDSDTGSAFEDDDTDVTVNKIPVADSVAEKIVETDKAYVRQVVSQGGISADNTAPYSSMRRRPVRSEAVSQNDATPKATVADERPHTYYSNEKAEQPAKKEPDKTSEIIAKANRSISNLKIQKARVTVLAMGIGLCCLILLIIVICLGVSNSNLKEEIASLKNNGPVTDYTPNTNTGNKNPSSTLAPTKAPESTTATSDSAMTAYNNAKSLFDEGKFLEAADLLAVTDLTVLDYNNRTAAESLYKEAVNKFSTEYNNQMLGNIVPPENWSAVIEYGLPVYRHNIEQENPEFTGNGASICFHIGKAYEMTGDKEKAKEFYNITMNKFPGVNYADYAKSRLSGLE
ncbi:MAG: tetratricopeptide repeat protein [Ruminococcaceae bacterium]|nr:tetratricopeptide repeat protein [Oscillospiraceae bacterium]